MTERPAPAEGQALALRDALTGVYARAAFDARLREAIERGREGEPFAFCLIDLDYFKSINDAYGHRRGDEALREVAERLGGAIRGGDLLFRYGGDEFVLLLPGTTLDAATTLAERLLGAVRDRPLRGEPPLTLALSIGVAACPADTADPDGVFEIADRRSQEAKRRGRGRVIGHDGPASVPPEVLVPPGRLIERDEALAVLQGFLVRLADPPGGRGVLAVVGPAGTGRSRFLAEVAEAARLRGYRVAASPGEIPPLDVALDAGLLVVLDGLSAREEATLDLARAWLERPSPWPVAVAYVADPAATNRLVTIAAPLRATVALRPLSPAGVRVWAREALRWEPPAPFLDWLHRATGGLPAGLRDALAGLTDAGLLAPAPAGGWTLDPAYATRTLPQRPARGRPAQPRVLPAALTDFFGREEELRAVLGLLGRGRLVTLAGPGGIGKTRLALQAAAAWAESGGGGVYFVPLATIGDPALVLPAIAAILGVKEATGSADAASSSPATALHDFLRARRDLLVLDNFEQIIAAAPLVGELLAAVPGLRALVTSREPLRLYGERSFAVPPLPLPDPAGRPSLDQVAASPAGALFADRAGAAAYDFALTAENAGAVAALCARLDGIPLAIELAAARSATLSPAQMLAQEGIGGRLALLVDGPRDHAARQQTLRGTLDWSYALLNRDEQDLVARLAPFVGGCTVEAATVVCRGPGAGATTADPPDAAAQAPMLALLRSLADKSFLREAGARFTMLPTIREYALDRAAALGEDEALRRRHAAYFQHLARRADPELRGPDQAVWYARLEDDHDNFRAAIGWAIERGEARSALQLSGDLWRFWHQRGHLREGRRWLDAALALPVPADDSLASDHARAGQRAAILARVQGDYERATELLRACRATFARLENRRGLGDVLNSLGLLAIDRGEWAQARSAFEESLALEEPTNREGIAITLNNLGGVALHERDWAAAQARFEASLMLRRALGDRWGIANSLKNLGETAVGRGDNAAALPLYQESLRLRAELGDQPGGALVLEELAGVWASFGDDDRAARLLGTAAAIREAIAVPVPPDRRAPHAQLLADLRARLGEAPFAVASAAGRALTLPQAVELACRAGQ